MGKTVNHLGFKKYDKSHISPYRREWLVESHLSGCFCLFALKFWEGGEYLRMIICLSMNAV